MAHFNALKSFDRLKDAGIPEDQARAIVETVEESSMANFEAVATKGDLKQLEIKLTSEINEVKISIGWLQKLYFSSVLLIIINIAITWLHH